MRIIKLTLILFFMVIGAAFAVMNAAPVSLNYYLGTTEVPLALILVVALMAGAVLGVMVSLGSMMRLRHESSELRRKLHLSREEIDNLRSLPIKD